MHMIYASVLRMRCEPITLARSVYRYHSCIKQILHSSTKHIAIHWSNMLKWELSFSSTILELFKLYILLPNAEQAVRTLKTVTGPFNQSRSCLDPLLHPINQSPQTPKPMPVCVSKSWIRCLWSRIVSLLFVQLWRIGRSLYLTQCPYTSLSVGTGALRRVLTHRLLLSFGESTGIYFDPVWQRVLNAPFLLLDVSGQKS